MKYFAQQNQVWQRVVRSDNLTKKITEFEQYGTYQSSVESNCQKFEIPMQCDYLRIYVGQVIVVITEILKHLNDLHSQQLSHGQLLPKNIWIQLKDQTGFSLTYQKIKVKRVFFVCCKYFEDSEYQINVKDDVELIINSILKFIDVILEKAQNNKSLNSFKEFLNNNKNEYDIQKLLSYFHELKLQILDDQQQQIKKCFGYDEFDGKSFFKSKREKIEGSVGIYLEELSQYQMNNEIQIMRFKKQLQDKKNQNNDFQSKNFIEKFESQESQTFYFNTLVFQLQKNIIHKFCRDIGRHLNLDNNNQSFQDLALIFEDKINNDLDIFHKNFFETMSEEYQNIDKVCDEIQKSIQQFYKFQIERPILLGKELLSQEIKLKLQDFDILNEDIHSFFQQVKDNVKVQLQEYYDLELQLSLLHLQNQLN